MIKALMYVDLKELVASVTRDIAQLEEDAGEEAVEDLEGYIDCVYEQLWCETLCDYVAPKVRETYVTMEQGEAAVAECVTVATDRRDKTMRAIVSTVQVRLHACSVYGATAVLIPPKRW